jgi:hypothetical protein
MNGQSAILGGTQTAPASITGSTTIPDAMIPRVWARMAWEGERQSDYFMQFEGKGQNSVIQEVTDTTKDAGMTVRFPTYEGYYGRVKRGDAYYDVVADFDKPTVGGFELVVDYIHHATSTNLRADAITAMRYELIKRTPEGQGKVLGDVKFRQLALELVARTPSDNRMVINNRGVISGSSLGLRSADTLSWAGIVNANARLSGMGGDPAMLGRDQNGIGINKYLVALTKEALTSLKSDADYKAYAKDAGSREGMNKIFKGEYYDVDGNVLVPYQNQINAANAPMYSPFSPRAVIGSGLAIAAGVPAGQLYLKMGTNVLYDYFQDFPGFAYPFTASDTLAWTNSLIGGVNGTGPWYVLVYDPATGRSGMCEYAVNSTAALGYHALSITKMLSGTATDGEGTTTILKNTLGNVTVSVSATSLWTSVAGVGTLASQPRLLDPKTDGYPAGCYLFPCNSNGVPYGYTVLMGKRAALRGYGSERNVRGEDIRMGGFQREQYIRSVVGQTLAKDVANRTPGVMLLAHALAYPGITFPTIA